MFARKTTKKQNKKTDYIQNGYLDVDSVLHESDRAPGSICASSGSGT